MNPSAFATHGIEIEYMIVDEATLEILPIADEVIRELAGGEAFPNEVIMPPFCWSNELALHVIELKTEQPVSEIMPMVPVFQNQIQSMNAVLARRDALLLPTAMHPSMDPRNETRLWPHEDREIYETFDRIFGCNTHGWANLQSTHLNLPFHDEVSFLALHHALRLVIPLLPALAASSPIIEGLSTGVLDNRLNVYRSNCAKFPCITGQVVPEAVGSGDDYHAEILSPIYRAIAEVETSGVLQYEWLNARGAITRFDRNTIELRVLDSQECPLADLALHSVVECLVDYLMRTARTAEMAAVPQDGLVSLYNNCVAEGGRAHLHQPELMELLGLPAVDTTLHEVWQRIAAGPAMENLPSKARGHLDFLLSEGCLALRILRTMEGDVSHDRIRDVYLRLAGCLNAGKAFVP